MVNAFASSNPDVQSHEEPVGPRAFALAQCDDSALSPAVLGVVLAIGGSVLIVSYAPSSDKQLTMEVLEEYMSDASFIVFVSCLVIATV